MVKGSKKMKYCNKYCNYVQLQKMLFIKKMLYTILFIFSSSFFTVIADRVNAAANVAASTAQIVDTSSFQSNSSQLTQPTSQQNIQSSSSTTQLSSQSQPQTPFQYAVSQSSSPLKYGKCNCCYCGKGSMSAVIKQVLPSVVEIIVDEKAGDFEQNRQNSVGAGFIIHENGYIVTNSHVIGESASVKVILHDGGEYYARIIGRDECIDAALLKIDVLKDRVLTPIVWENSNDIDIGDPVLAVGNPFGFGGTVTSGIVSFKGRDIASRIDDSSSDNLVNYIQTDASINVGNSGGPLFLYNGKVIGMISVIFSESNGNSGINFAIPSNLLRKNIEQLKLYGKVKRSWLGVEIEIISSEVAEILGFTNGMTGGLVTYIEKDSPADKSGLMVNDIILSIDKQNITKNKNAALIINDLQIGAVVPIKILRENKEFTFSITVGYKDDYGGTYKVSNFKILTQNSVFIKDCGFFVSSAKEESVKNTFDLQDSNIINGVVITSFDKAMLKFNPEFSVGDVILKLNNEVVLDVGDFQNKIQKIKSVDESSFSVVLGKVGEKAVEKVVAGCENKCKIKQARRAAVLLYKGKSKSSTYKELKFVD